MENVKIVILLVAVGLCLIACWPRRYKEKQIQTLYNLEGKVLGFRIKGSTEVFKTYPEAEKAVKQMAQKRLTDEV